MNSKLTAESKLDGWRVKRNASPIREEMKRASLDMNAYVCIGDQQIRAKIKISKIKITQRSLRFTPGALNNHCVFLVIPVFHILYPQFTFNCARNSSDQPVVIVLRLASPLDII